MNWISFIVGLVLLVLSVFLIRGTSPYSSCGGTKYERRRQRRLVGILIMVIAILITIFGLLTQFALSHA